MSDWYLVHTKIRQERVALENLERQGYKCFLPTINTEKVRQRALQIVSEAMFPRYLFVQLSTDANAQSWAPIQSTVGVCRLVKFGTTPAKVNDDLIQVIRSRMLGDETLHQFNPGDLVQVTEGPFVGLDAIYQSKDGEERVVILLNLLCKDVRMSISPAGIKKSTR